MKKITHKRLEKSPHGIMVHTQFGADKFLFFPKQINFISKHYYAQICDNYTCHCFHIYSGICFHFFRNSLRTCRTRKSRNTHTMSWWSKQKIHYWRGTTSKNACSENILMKIVQPITNTWTASRSYSSASPKWGYTAKHQLNLSGATDYRIYSDRKWAVWKNNNPSGITYPVSPTLRNLWTDRGIRYEMWTPRPKVEWWNYYRFYDHRRGFTS